MKHGLLTPCSLVVLWGLALCLGTVSCEALRSDKAYRSGDYAKAAKELEYIAEEGDARDILYEKMTPEQVARASELLREYEKARNLDNSCQLCPLLKGKSTP